MAMSAPDHRPVPVSRSRRDLRMTSSTLHTTNPPQLAHRVHARQPRNQIRSFPAASARSRRDGDRRGQPCAWGGNRMRPAARASFQETRHPEPLVRGNSTDGTEEDLLEWDEEDEGVNFTWQRVNLCWFATILFAACCWCARCKMFDL
jgi:hypothetical protein